MNFRFSPGRLLAGAVVLLSLAACGGGSSDSPPTFTIGGAVTGLDSGAKVVLKDNGGDALTVSANGTYTFVTPVASNGTYAVTVATQPTAQTCTVANYQGAGVTANVTNVNVTCSDVTFPIGGTVSGLNSGASVVLTNNGGDAVTVAANGTFAFPTSVASNGSYAVVVATGPTGETCTVSNGQGAGVVAAVTNVAVTCSPITYAISGSVTGLASGQQVTLQNNGGDSQTVTANGPFAFAVPVAFNGSYAVTVNAQPTGQTCTVSPNGAASGIAADVSTIVVTCSTNTFHVNVAVTGLPTGQQITLNNNLADPLIASGSGNFQFATPVAYGSSYSVTIPSASQPAGLTCTVNNPAAGSGVVADVNVQVTCSPITFTVGGTISGLTSGQITLNNGGDSVTVQSSGNGTFQFPMPVAYNGSYSVTTGPAPAGLTCSVSANQSANNVTANVSNVGVTCSPITLTVTGSVSGLATGQQVTLLNNGDSLHPATVTASGSQSFSFSVAYGSPYAVTVSTLPTNETCTVAGGSGSNVTTNITGVVVTCRQPVLYTVNSGGNSVSQFTINPDGSLTQLAADIATDVAPFGLTADAAGKHAYVTNMGTPGTTLSSITQYTIAPDGHLVPMATPSISTGAADTIAYSLTLDPSGTHAYVVNRGNGASGSFISVYTVGSNGALTHVSDSPVVGNGRPHFVTFNAAGTIAYIPSYDGGYVDQYVVGSDGSLTLNGAAPAPATGAQPYVMTIDASGTHAYITNYNGQSISEYTIDPSTGYLSATTPPSIATTVVFPWNVTIDPAGQYAYAANSANGSVNGSLSQYSVDPTTGLLTFVADVATDISPQTSTIDPTGHFLYVVSLGHSDITAYAIGTNGALTILPGASNTYDSADTGANPYSLTIVK